MRFGTRVIVTRGSDHHAKNLREVPGILVGARGSIYYVKLDYKDGNLDSFYPTFVIPFAQSQVRAAPTYLSYEDAYQILRIELDMTYGRFGPEFEQWKEAIISRLDAEGLCNNCCKGLYWCDRKAGHGGFHTCENGALSWER